MKMNWILLPVAALIFLFCYSGIVQSKDLEASNDESFAIDDITVTAQKKEANMQDVPISMSVFDEYAVIDKQMKSIGDIDSYTPGLMLNDNGGRGSLSSTMRGLHTESGSFSPSVVMFVDGVPVTNTTGFDIPLSDIERIEVLRGPQGTLYGKGSEAGVINVITAKPDNNAKGSVRIEAGRDRKMEGAVNIRGPVVKDKLYIGVSGRHYEKDGFLENLNLGGYSDDREQNQGKVYLRYTPTDAFEFSLISSVVEHDDGGLTWGAKDASRVNYNSNEYIKTKTNLNAFKIEFNKGNYKIESITTQTRTNDAARLDYDFTPDVNYEMELDSEVNNISQEFRIGSDSEKFSWLMGVNLSEDDNTLDYDLYYYGYIMPTYAELDGQSIGVFLNANYNITRNLILEGGIRYDNNEYQYKEPDDGIDLESTSEAVSPKISLSYNLNDETMVYSTIARGYRPAGFYAYAPDGYSKEYEKETLWSYEVGSKHGLLDNHLILNTAFYYMKIDDMQVTNSIANSSQVYKSNAAEAVSKGLECELTYLFNSRLKFFFSVGYNDTSFDEYVDETGDYSGNTNPYAPKYNYNTGAQYRSEQGYFARVDVNGYGSMYLDKENTTKRDAYNLVNLKIGYETEQYDVYLYGKNIFDEEYDSIGYSNIYRIYSPPGEVGIQMALRF